jgi:hypothetical protein
MTVYTMDQLRTLVGQGGGNKPSQHLNDDVTLQRPMLAEKHVRERIYDFVIQSGGAVNRDEIAKGLKLKKTPWLLNHIEQLVSDGYLHRTQGYWKNGVVMYWYEVRK